MSQTRHQNSGSWWLWFRIWQRAVHLKQIRGRERPHDTMQSHHCMSCGENYKGNYCPRCGQSQDSHRFTMSNLLHNVVSDFTDIESGFLHTIIELFWRPGYMIRDYISGKRAHYFRPFKLFFIICAISAILVRLVFPSMFLREEVVNYNTINSQITRLKEIALVPESKELFDQIKTLQDSILTIEMRAIQDSIRLGGDISALGIGNEATDEMMQRFNHWSEMHPEDREQIEKAREDYMRAQGEMMRDVNSLREEYLGDGTVLGSRYGIISSYISNNAPMGMLIMLPIFLFCTWRSFRKTPIGKTQNAAERIIMFVYLASQLIIAQLILMLVTGTYNTTALFGIPMGILLIWDFKQLYDLTWKNSIFRFVVYMCGYTFVITIALSFLYRMIYYYIFRTYL